MSEFMREALPIAFMYLCVLALGPFIAVAMWMAFDGDRLREDEAEAAVDATSTQARHLEVAPAAGLATEATPAA